MYVCVFVSLLACLFLCMHAQSGDTISDDSGTSTRHTAATLSISLVHICKGSRGVLRV